MSKIAFGVTYEFLNEKEASIGDTERRGFLGRDLTLREALELLREEIDDTETIEFSACPLPEYDPCSPYIVWLSVCGRNWTTGDSVTNSLHPSVAVSPASWNRIKALI